MKIWHLQLDCGIALSGATVAARMRRIAECSKSRSCLVYGIEGGGQSLSLFAKADDDQEILRLNDLLAAALLMDQFDWGDFFFGPPFPRDFDFQRDGYVGGILSSKALMRCVDGSDLDVYGEDKDICGKLRELFPNAEYNYGEFTNLDFPR